jgi:DNA-binding NarL/FixJ family response regulator
MNADPGQARRIRVLIVDDQALVRRSIALMLSLEPDMQVVGEASDGIEAVDQAHQLHPDVVLMDLHMPRKGGVAATREITSAQPQVRVLVLTTMESDQTVFDAVRAGALAYLLKDASEPEVVEAVRAVYRGESRLTPQIARKVLDQFRLLSNRAPATDFVAASPDAVSALNDKEARVLELIAGGMTNRQIASALFLAEGTVKNYVSRIMAKLQASSRTELAVMLVRQRRVQ